MRIKLPPAVGLAAAGIWPLPPRARALFPATVLPAALITVLPRPPTVLPAQAGIWRLLAEDATT